jgi:hypothetical protein
MQDLPGFVGGALSAHATVWTSRALALTAVMNAIAGIASALFPALHAELLLAPGTVLDGVTLRYHVMLWLFVAAMAPGYAVASRDPARQTALMLCAGIGKLAAVAVWVEMVASGYGTSVMALGIVFDGVLGAWFLAFAVSHLVQGDRT